MNIIGSLCFVTDPAINQLKVQLRHTQQAAFAQGTMNNLQIQWNSYFSFCQRFKFVSIPATSQTICLYIQHLANVLKSPDSVRNYLNGVKVLHLLSDASTVAFQSFEVKLTLKGMRRLKAHHPKQAAPITVPILQAFFLLLDVTKPFDATCWALILIAFYCMLRKSNLVPESAHKFDPTKQLTRSDIQVNSKCLLVHIKWSKTIQFAQRKLTIPLLAIPGSHLCPVQAYTNMLKLVKAGPQDPAFSLLSNHGIIPLTYRQLLNKIKSLAAGSGFDPSAYSTHSLRRGGASLAFKLNVPGEIIKVQGDWSSSAYLRYLNIPLRQRVMVAAAVRDFVLYGA